MKVWKWAGLTILVLALITGCGGETEQAEMEGESDREMTREQAQQGEPMGDEMQMPDLSTLEMQEGEQGLTYAVLNEGDGQDVKEGDRARVHYTGWFKDNGNVFDSSRRRGEPFSFVVGKGQVIKGWDLGVGDMQVGDRRLLVLPPELAYGERGYPGAIPPNSTLVFDVEVLGVE